MSKFRFPYFLVVLANAAKYVNKSIKKILKMKTEQVGWVVSSLSSLLVIFLPI